MGNFSKQREEIKQAVLKSEQHLTAEEIYNIVKQKNEKISLATVYRRSEEHTSELQSQR